MQPTDFRELNLYTRKITHLVPNQVPLPKTNSISGGASRERLFGCGSKHCRVCRTHPAHRLPSTLAFMRLSDGVHRAVICRSLFSNPFGDCSADALLGCSPGCHLATLLPYLWARCGRARPR